MDGGAFQHWKYTLDGLVFAAICIPPMGMSLEGIPGDDDGSIRLSLFLASLLGMVAGSGIFAYGVFVSRPGDDELAPLGRGRILAMAAWAGLALLAVVGSVALVLTIEPGVHIESRVAGPPVGPRRLEDPNPAGSTAPTRGVVSIGREGEGEVALAVDGDAWKDLDGAEAGGDREGLARLDREKWTFTVAGGAKGIEIRRGDLASLVSVWEGPNSGRYGWVAADRLHPAGRRQ
jgi:hypothetical protein